MRISVIIPTFQSEKYIRQTLESINLQSRLPDEVIISDDGSNDATLSLIESFAKESKFEILLVHHARAGISSNYLNALVHSSGDIIIVGDHDDVWAPGKIEVIYHVFANQPDVSIVSSDSEIVDEHLIPLGTTLRGGRSLSLKQSRMALKDDFCFFLAGARLDAHTLAFRGQVREIMKSINCEPVENFWFEERVAIVAMSFGKLHFLPDSLTLYRQYSEQHRGYSAPSIRNALQWELGSKLEKLSVLQKLFQENGPRSLISESESKRRLSLLAQFVGFVQLRNSIDRPVQKMRKLSKSMFNGDYRRFTRNSILSFSKDVFRTFAR